MVGFALNVQKPMSFIQLKTTVFRGWKGAEKDTNKALQRGRNMAWVAHIEEKLQG